MSDTIVYTFKIKNFTPQNMPFGRLVEYYAEIKKMLGVADHVHLIEILESSHGSAFAIDRRFESDLEKRFIEIESGTAPRTAKRAHDKINDMLKEDKTSGAFIGPESRNIIEFPGKRPEGQADLYIRDAASFTGELYYVLGTREDVKIRISTDMYGVVLCTTTKELAKNLREFIFEDVKVSGRGVWRRSVDGAWTIDNFTITDFYPIRKENLRQAIDRIRALNVEWPDDPLDDIRSLNKD